MRTTTTVAIAATLLTSAHAINLAAPRPGVAPRAVKHEIQRIQVVDPVERDRRRMQKRALRKRDNTVEVDLTNEETLYFMDVTAGTPPQKLQLHLDTGSSDMWVNVASSDLCDSRGNPCAQSGTYAPNSSSTYSYVNSDFNISYVDGSGAAGDYVTDVVRIADVELDNQQFAIGYTSSSEQGIMGVGYPLNEVAVTFVSDPTYANVPQAMVQNGNIATNAYSLWLNDLEASMGSILFGGVNTEKFEGTLQTLPIIKEQGYYAEFIIALTSIGWNGTEGSISSNLNTPALLDSGSSLMYLPNDITQTIYDAVGAQYSSAEGAAFVDCSLATSDATIDFTFSSPTIRVAMNELVILAGTENGQPVCIFGISPAGDITPVLGDTFLRSAYVVYDIASNEISLAQTNFNSTQDNILEITSASAIPSATVVTNAVTSVAIETGNAIINDIPSGVASEAFAMPTAAIGYNAALLGAVGAGFAMAL